jgi:hypothetical protein
MRRPDSFDTPRSVGVSFVVMWVLGIIASLSLSAAAIYLIYEVAQYLSRH